MSLFAFTNRLWKKAYGFFLQRFSSKQKAYLAKKSESIAINIFSPRQFGESTQNNLNIDQVLEVVQHYLVNKKASPVLTHIKAALLVNIGKYPHMFTEQFFSSHQFWNYLEQVLFNSSLLNDDILNLSDLETRQKLLKLALMLAPDSFSADLKIAIAKQFSGLADFILFTSEINSNLTLEQKKQIIRFYLTPEEQAKPSNRALIEKLRAKKLYLDDAFDNQDLAELYISGGFLKPEDIALTTLLHSIDFLNQQWNTVKNTLLKNDKTGQETRTEFFWGLQTAFLQLPTYQVELKKKEKQLEQNAAYSETAEYKSAQLAYTKEKKKYEEAKAVFQRALLLIHNCELIKYLPPNLKTHADQLATQAVSSSPASTLSIDRDSDLSSENSNQKLGDYSEVSLSSSGCLPRNRKENKSDKLKAEQEKLLNEIMHTLFLLNSVKSNGKEAIIAELCRLRTIDRHSGITDQAVFALAINPDYPEIAQAALHFICDTQLIGTPSEIKSFNRDTLGKIFIHYKDDVTAINKIFNYLRGCKKHITNSGLANNPVSNNITAAYQLAHENKAFADALFSHYENASILLSTYGIINTAISLEKKHGQDFVRKHILTLAESAVKNPLEKQEFFKNEASTLFDFSDEAFAENPLLPTLLCQNLKYVKGTSFAKPGITAHQIMVEILVKLAKFPSYYNAPLSDISLPRPLWVADIKFNNDVAKTKAARALECTQEDLEKSLFVYVNEEDLENTNNQLAAHGVTKNEYEVKMVFHRDWPIDISKETFNDYSHKSTLLFARPTSKIEYFHTEYTHSLFDGIYSKACEKLNIVKELFKQITDIAEQIKNSISQLPTPPNNSDVTAPPRVITPPCVTSATPEHADQAVHLSVTEPAHQAIPYSVPEVFARQPSLAEILETYTGIHDKKEKTVKKPRTTVYGFDIPASKDGHRMTPTPKT